MNGILIVDDELLIAAQLREYLESMGYGVAGTAQSGEEAVNKARSLKPALILMDIRMDGVMDGITAAETIKHEMDIPVIFVTAYGNERIVARAKTVEPAGFITKPFSLEELKASIEVALYKIDREKALKSSEERYRSVVSASVEAILIIDIRLKIVFWNRAAEGMFGYTAEEIEGKPFLQLIPARLRRDLGVEIERMVLTEEKDPVARTTETIGQRRDGREFPLEFSLSSWIIRDDIFFTINARDITDRKKIEQMKTDFVSLVSHQLKTPVAGVLGCIENLLAGLAGPVTPQQEEYLLMMKDISLRNFRTINDLLNVSRIERGVMEAKILSVNLKVIAAGVVREHLPALREKGLWLRLEGWKDRFNTLADRDKLFESLSNVFHNAVKFTDRGWVAMRLKKQAGFAVVEIEDTGPGIPSNIKNHIFTKDMILRGAPDPNRGSGLGLFIAMEFMKLQNGGLSTDSSSDRGSRFTFRIPLDERNTAG
jgi:PAS domain S-box-containing protein